jgi:hypothetical protein
MWFRIREKHQLGDEHTNTHDNQGDGQDDNRKVVVPYDIAPVDLQTANEYELY